MARPPLHLPDDPDVEQGLSDLGPRLEFPPTPDLAGSVHAALTATSPRHRLFPPMIALPRPRRWALAALALALLIVALVALAPDLRTTIAKRLGLRGIAIVVVTETPALHPAAVASPVGTTLLLGERLTLAEARASVAYPVHLPAALGPPDEVYLRHLSSGPMVSLLYHPRPGLPSAAETGVGVLLMQFPATDETVSLVKRVSMNAGFISEVRVAGNDGYWISGATDLVIAEDPTAAFGEASSRPSANVLIWRQDDLTFRLESALSEDDSVSIAGSLMSTDQA